MGALPPRAERVAGLVFFGALWVLSLVMGTGSKAEVLGVVAWGLALATSAPMAFSDSVMVWRVCKGSTIALVVVGVVLQLAGGL